MTTSKHFLFAIGLPVFIGLSFLLVRQAANRGWWGSDEPMTPRRLSSEATHYRGLLEEVYGLVYVSSRDNGTRQEQRRVISDLLICASTKKPQDCADAAHEFARHHGRETEYILRTLESLIFVMPSYRGKLRG